jgi:hypothetical protein
MGPSLGWGDPGRRNTATLRFLPMPLTQYRVHGNNLWAGSSTSSGEEIKMILSQHRLAAQAGGEFHNLRAIRQGRRYVLPSQAQFAMTRSNEARLRHEYGRAITFLVRALVASPLVVTRVLARGVRTSRRAKRAVSRPRPSEVQGARVEVPRIWIINHWVS